MNRIVWILALLLLPSWPVEAQIRLGLSLAPSTALHHERVHASLNVLNETGSALSLDTNGNARLRWVVRDTRGQQVYRWKGDGDVWHATRIDAARLGGVTNALNELYRLSPGSYTVEAEVSWRELVFTSERRYLEIVPGIPIAEIRAGTPAGGDRLYVLRSLNRERNDRLFLRIEDPAREAVLGVFDLGRVVRIQPPSTRLDDAGRVHILHQSGPYDYTYTVALPDGRIERSSHHGGENRLVRLKSLQDGQVEIHESRSGTLTYPGQPESIVNPPRETYESSQP